MLTRRKRQAVAEPEPEPALVTTGRATIVEVSRPLRDAGEASAWLEGAGEADLAAGLAVLNRALHTFRLVTADPYARTIGRGDALVARIGYGAGDEVADGRWSDARELLLPDGRVRRAKVLEPQARLAAVLGRREHELVCEELALRAHIDLTEDRPRAAALQVLVALDAAVAELSVDALAGRLAGRIDELRELRDAVTGAGQAALAGDLSPEQTEVVSQALGRIEAALRFRAVQNA